MLQIIPYVLHLCWVLLAESVAGWVIRGSAHFLAVCADGLLVLLGSGNCYCGWKDGFLLNFLNCPMHHEIYIKATSAGEHASQHVSEIVWLPKKEGAKLDGNSTETPYVGGKQHSWMRIRVGDGYPCGWKLSNSSSESRFPNWGVVLLTSLLLMDFGLSK
jgi:hypothetical protein